MHLVSATMVLGALTRWLRAARFPDHVRPSWGIEGQGGERKPGTVNLFCQKYWISGLYFSQPPSSAVPAELLKIEVRFSATSDLPSFVFNSTVMFHKNSWSSRLWFSLPWSSAVPAEQLKFEVPILPTPNFSRFEVWLASCSDRTTENGDSGIPGMTSFFFSTVPAEQLKSRFLFEQPAMALDLKFEWNQPFGQNRGNFWFEHSWDEIYFLTHYFNGTMLVEAIGLFPKNQYY